MPCERPDNSNEQLSIAARSSKEQGRARRKVTKITKQFSHCPFSGVCSHWPPRLLSHAYNTPALRGDFKVTYLPSQPQYRCLTYLLSHYRCVNPWGIRLVRCHKTVITSCTQLTLRNDVRAVSTHLIWATCNLAAGWCIKLWDITSLGSVQVVGFFEVAARLSAGAGREADDIYHAFEVPV